jgi:1-deoxy-D-xylulose-5-phosphate reductoisomerase
VHAFLGGKIGFLDISATVERTLELMPGGSLESLDDVYNFDRTAREIAAKLTVTRANARVAEPTDIGS